MKPDNTYNDEWLKRAAIRLFPPLKIGTKVIIKNTTGNVYTIEKITDDGAYVLDTWIDKAIERDMLIPYNDSDPIYKIGQTVAVNDPVRGNGTITATINNIIPMGNKPTIQYIYEFDGIKGQFHENYIVSVKNDVDYKEGDYVEIIRGSYKGTVTQISKVYDDDTYDVECIPNEIHFNKFMLKPVIMECGYFKIGNSAIYNGQKYTIVRFIITPKGNTQALLFKDNVSYGYVDINKLLKTDFHKDFKVGDYVQLKKSEYIDSTDIYMITKIYPDDIHMDILYVMSGATIFMALKENFKYAYDFDESKFKYTVKDLLHTKNEENNSTENAMVTTVEELFDIYKVIRKYVHLYTYTFWSPVYGEIKFESVAEDRRLTFSILNGNDDTFEVYCNGCVWKKGICIVFPSKELYYNYPTDPIKAWNEWRLQQSRNIKTKNRAKDKETYYYIDQFGTVIKATDFYTEMDNCYYNVGNYFLSIDDANNKADKILNIFKEE